MKKNKNKLIALFSTIIAFGAVIGANTSKKDVTSTNIEHPQIMQAYDIKRAESDDYSEYSYVYINNTYEIGKGKYQITGARTRIDSSDPNFEVFKVLKSQTITLQISPFEKMTISNLKITKNESTEDISLEVTKNNEYQQNFDAKDFDKITVYFDFIDAPLTVWDQILKFISSAGVITVVITMGVTIIGRAAVKLFKLGQTYRYETVSKQEFINFENNIKQEMKLNKQDSEDTIIKIAMQYVSREIAPLVDMKEIAEELKSQQKMQEIRDNQMDEKYQEIKAVLNTVNKHEKEIQIIKYGENDDTVRRSAK